MSGQKTDLWANGRASLSVRNRALEFVGECGKLTHADAEALADAITEGLKLIKQLDGKVACCPKCEVPLVYTFAFDNYEFYCLDCGGMWGMFGPVADVPATMELIAAKDRRRDEFAEHAANYLPTSRRHDGLSEEKRQLHNEACQWLEDRKVNRDA